MRNKEDMVHNSDDKIQPSIWARGNNKENAISSKFCPSALGRYKDLNTSFQFC